ncbi:LD-carboxypeptidase [Rossellomorea sp. RS05]|uniref:S66 peptidase family protein n=1 Tax=Rossellomorea sp. RS05 TaxID=3149166 RepID=UPI003221F4AD
MKASPLQKGDKVGVIAPASPPNVENFKKALPFLKELGLEPVIGKHLYEKNGYLAGKDEERLADLHDMFRDPEIKGIICACGGVGTGRIVSDLDFGLIGLNPKIFWGYSDITFLHTAIFQQTGLVTFHGPMLSSDIGLDSVPEWTKKSFDQLFGTEDVIYPESLSTIETLVEGKADGAVVGGNLTLLVNSLGTPHEIDTKGKLFFIEEIDEEPYKVDRMLNQLKMAGKLADASGIIIGDFKNCDPVKQDRSLSLDEVINHHIIPAGKPTLKGFMIGHSSPSFAIPFGAHGFMDTQDLSFRIESGLRKGS